MEDTILNTPYLNAFIQGSEFRFHMCKILSLTPANNIQLLAFRCIHVTLAFRPEMLNIIVFNPLPDDKILDWSKVKQNADDILKCIYNEK